MQGENPLCNIQYATVRMSLTFELIQVNSLFKKKKIKCNSIEFHQKLKSIPNIPQLAVFLVNSS